MWLRKIYIIGVWATIVSPSSAAELFEFTYKAPPDPSQLTSRSLWSTQYLVHAANAKPPTADTVELKKRDGSGTGVSLSKSDWCNAAMEGTVVVSKDKILDTYNVDGLQDEPQVDCSFVFHHTELSVLKRLSRQVFIEVNGLRIFGLGINGYRLVPFRTVATDVTVLPPGTVLFISGLRGRTIQLPDGTSAQHDGYVFAADRGGSIVGNHIDFFTGISKVNPAPTIITSSPTQTFIAFIVTDPSIVASLKELHLKK